MCGVKTFGAVGDGVTDDTVAIQAAWDAGVGFFPQGRYRHTATLRTNVPIVVSGSGATLEPDTSVVNAVAVRADGVTFRDLTFAGTSSYLTLVCDQDFHDTLIDACTFYGRTGVYVDGRDSVTVTDCRFFSESAVWAYRGASRVVVRGNRLTQWGSVRPAIFLQDSSQDCSIVGNHLSEPDQSGGAASMQYPIKTAGGVHSGLLVEGNTVVGTDKEFDLDAGTPDQLAFASCKGLRVIGNRSVDGGDMGITIDKTVSGAVVMGNECRGNDVAGIWVEGTDVTVVGNVCVDNGQDRQLNVKLEHLAGIVADSHSVRMVLAGNVCHGQPYGLSLDGALDANVGANMLLGNTVAGFVA